MSINFKSFKGKVYHLNGYCFCSMHSSICLGCHFCSGLYRGVSLRSSHVVIWVGGMKTMYKIIGKKNKTKIIILPNIKRQPHAYFSNGVHVGQVSGGAGQT